MIRLSLPKKVDELKSNILLQVDPIPNSEKNLKVLFDIDVYKESIIGIWETDRLFSDYGKIRDFKNEIFFTSLTERTLKFFT